MKRMLLFVATAALVTAACSSDDTDETDAAAVAAPGSTSTTTAAPVTTTAPTIDVSTSSTAAPTTTTMAPGSITPGDDPDVDAVVLAYQIVFSSETGYDEKVPYLVDPTGLEETVANYQETGTSMGGVALAPTAVSIDGAVADVSYDLLFGGSPTYPDLSGDAVLVGDTWKITREMFCGMMASARVGCPAS